MNEIIKLIKQTYTVNAAGDSIPTQVTRQVFAERRSIGLKRKMEAMEAGLKLGFKFVLADELEYQDETILEYNGDRYNIVDAFVTKDHEVELTAARF